MVAINSSRRHRSQPVPLSATEALASNRTYAVADGLAASRRGAEKLTVLNGPGGSIKAVRIGPWRSLSASPQRRIAEVKQLPSEHIAVRVERLADGGDRPSSEVWQLYDRQGRMEAAMQTSPDGKFAILTNYRTRQSSRIVRNGRDELETVETWNI